MKFTSSSASHTHRQTNADSGSSTRSSEAVSRLYRDSYSRIMNNPDLPKVVRDSSGRNSEGSYNASSGRQYVYPSEEDGIIEGEHVEPDIPQTEQFSYEEPVYAYENPSHRYKKAKKKRKLKGLKITAGIIAGIVCLYLFGVYTSIPFIAKLRTLYVETAMMTMNHQWLATAFLPKSVIDEFRSNMDSYESQQDTVESNWDSYSTVSYTKLPSFTNASSDSESGNEENEADTSEPEVPFWQDAESDFYKIYYEIDYESFCEYAESHQDSMFDSEGNLFIDEADVGSKGTGILTTEGDEVLSIDTVNGIIIVRLSGLEYNGVLAIVKDPTMVGLEVTNRLDVCGMKIANMAEACDAVLAINASGFEDPDGCGNGGIVHGLLYKNGEKIKGSAGGNYKAIYFDSNYRLNVTAYSSKLDIYNGIEFKPALVVNGEAAVSGSFGWGIQPRTAIGQTEDGSVIMIVIDGRSTSSIGITVGDLAQIFLSYGAVQAGNLDGGSSSVMYYNGRLITSPCGGDKVNGRYLPDAFVVYRRTADTQIEDTSDEGVE